jgi:hypothetical protein
MKLDLYLITENNQIQIPEETGPGFVVRALTDPLSTRDPYRHPARFLYSYPCKPLSGGEEKGGRLAKRAKRSKPNRFILIKGPLKFALSALSGQTARKAQNTQRAGEAQRAYGR